jgi:hypothetical protein
MNHTAVSYCRCMNPTVCPNTHYCQATVNQTGGSHHPAKQYSKYCLEHETFRLEKPAAIGGMTVPTLIVSNPAYETFQPEEKPNHAPLPYRIAPDRLEAMLAEAERTGREKALKAVYGQAAVTGLEHILLSALTALAHNSLGYTVEIDGDAFEKALRGELKRGRLGYEPETNTYTYTVEAS